MVGRGVNQSQQRVQHIAQFRDRNFNDRSFFYIALKKGKHITEGDASKNETHNERRIHYGQLFVRRYPRLES